MKITRKQQEEIDFLCTVFNVEPNDEEIQDYLNVSVRGKGVGYKNIGGTNNSLLLAKRRLDISIKMWREDLTVGILGG